MRPLQATGWGLPRVLQWTLPDHQAAGTPAGPRTPPPLLVPAKAAESWATKEKRDVLFTFPRGLIRWHTDCINILHGIKNQEINYVHNNYDYMPFNIILHTFSNTNN